MCLRTKDIFGTEGSSRMARSGRDSGVDSRSCGFFRGKDLVARTCVIILMHVKLWPLQMPPASPLGGIYEREVRKAKIFRWIMNALKFIRTLAGREVCGESFRITTDFLKLIVGCTAGC